MVNQIHPPGYQTPFLDLHFPVANGFLFSKLYDKRDDFDFEMVNASYGVYNSQLIRFTRVCNQVTDFNVRNKCLLAHRGSTGVFLLLRISVSYWPTGVQLVFFFCSGFHKLLGAQGSPSSGSKLSL